MKDRAGNELTIGDKVLYLIPGTSSSWLGWGTVYGFTPKRVWITPWDKDVDHNILREPRSVVIPKE